MFQNVLTVQTCRDKQKISILLSQYLFILSQRFYQNLFILISMNTQYSSSRSTNIPTNQPQQSVNRGGAERLGGFQGDAIRETLLKWSSLGEGRQDVVIHGESDVALLRNLRNILLSLQTQFTEGGAKVTFTGEKKDDFNKRLILLENEIDGLLKRKIQYTARDQSGGTRVLDYTGLLNEKETQVVELEKKINNLEERLRRASARELELENHIAQLYAQLKRKEEIIKAKNQVILAEVAANNATNRLDIKADLLTKDGAASRSGAYSSLPQASKYKTQLVALFREFERLNNQGTITDADIERILEGFLVGFNGSRIKESVDLAITRRKLDDDYIRLKEQFGVAVGLFQGLIERLKKENPTLRIDIDPRVFDVLRDHKIAIFKTAGDIVHLERFSERTVEVPVQDARTKHLIHLLAVQMKKFTSKYPKLIDEMDVRLSEFFQQQLIDVIQVDQVDRLVEIVKYVPQVVKVENVYAYSSEKSRKIEFHLRVLVKALLEELEKLKRKTGAVLEIDEGVIGMINQQIMGVVDVDDILKVFRVVPKIVEVEKIVEKIVDRIVEVPQVVAVEKIVEKIVEIEKIREVERIVNVPLEVPTIVPNIVEKVVPVERIVQKIVEVPQIIERIVEVIKEVPKVQIVERIEERPVEVQRVVEVERVVNHIETKVQIVEVIVQKPVPTERIVEIIKQVPVVVEKVIDRVVEIPKIIEVEKIVERIVPVVQYRNAKQVENHIEVRHNIVDRIVQRPVPIIQTVERIVEVPQIVEKVITVERVIQQIKQVEKIVEKIVVQDRIQEVVKQVKIPVEVIRQVIKQVEKIVEIPVIHERLITVQQIVEKPVVQKIENTIIKEVYLRDPIIVKEPKTIEVEKIVNHYIDVPKPIKYIEEKIVEVVKHVDRIKEIKVPVEKVIEKMVEVPKVVEVEKIVEKVVVVPRVVEKVVEVPQIVERVVPKIIVQQKIREVEKIVQVPMIQDKVVEVEVPKNVYIEVQKIVEKIVDKLVEVPKYEEKIINNQVIVEKVIEVIKEVPRNIEVEKIVHVTIDNPKVVEIERQIIVPVQVPVPTEKIVEKIVPITEIIQKPVQVPQVIEKIVSIREEIVEIKEIPRMEEKIVTNVEYRQIVKEVPYITEKIKQVEKIVEKPVPVQSVVQEIVTAQQIIEKIVEKTNTIPKVYEVERLREKVIEIPKIVQVEKIIPQIVNVNKFIQSIVEKIVQVPIIVEQIKEVVRENEKIVEVRNEYETVKQVEAIVQKAVVVEKFKEVVRNINHIEKVLQIVDRLEQSPVEVLVQEQKLVEVPYILEKIVEKIVIMPQIVEVLKYVHEVTEKEELGVAVGLDVATYEQRLKILSKDIKINFDLLLAELRKMKQANPGLRIQIQLIEKFLAQFEEFILYPKIFQVPRQKVVEKVVEKDRLVALPVDSERSIKMELTLSLLVEKLIVELKRLRKENPNLNLQLEDDVRLIFFTELDQGSNVVSGDFNARLKSFSDSIYRKFESLGSWSYDHQMMLNSFLQERFLMANLVKNANLQIEKAKTISARRDESVKRFESEIGVLEGYIGKIRSSLIAGGLTTEQESILNNIFREFDTYATTRIIGEPTRMLGDLAISDARIQSLIREKDAEILKLRDRIFSFEKGRVSGGTSQAANKIIEVLRAENLNLKNSLSELQAKLGSVELIDSYKAEIHSLQQRNLQLEQTISNLRSDLSNYKKEHEVGIRIYESNVKDSGVTGLDARSQASSLYQTSSPDSAIKMVQSSYKGAGETSSASRGPTYGTGSNLTDSRGASSATRQEASYGARTGTQGKDAGFRSTLQSDDRGSYGGDSRYSSTSGATGTSGTGASTTGTGARYGSTTGSVSGASGTGATGATGGTGAGYTSYGSNQPGGSSYSSGGSSSLSSAQGGTSSFTGQSGVGGGYGQTGSGYGQTGSGYGQTGGATYGSSFSGSGAGSVTGSGYGSASRPGTYQPTTGTSGTTGASGTGASGSGTGGSSSSTTRPGGSYSSSSGYSYGGGRQQ